MVPRDVFHALLEPKIRAAEGDRDIVVARVVARGERDGRPAEASVDLRVHPDEALGFTAMEQATGWHAAIMCHRMAGGRIPPGAIPVELFGETVFPKIGGSPYFLSLGPHTFYWFRLEKSTQS